MASYVQTGELPLLGINQLGNSDSGTSQLQTITTIASQQSNHHFLWVSPTSFVIVRGSQNFGTLGSWPTRTPLFSSTTHTHSLLSLLPHLFPPHHFLGLDGLRMSSQGFAPWVNKRHPKTPAGTFPNSHLGSGTIICRLFPPHPTPRLSFYTLLPRLIQIIHAFLEPGRL